MNKEQLLLLGIASGISNQWGGDSKSCCCLTAPSTQPQVLSVSGLHILLVTTYASLHILNTRRLVGYSSTADYPMCRSVGGDLGEN